MSAFDLDKFVNREKELCHIKDKVARLARGDPFAPHERVFHIIGPSGIGKSCLLDKYYNDFDKDQKCVPILIKLELLGNGHVQFVDNFLVTVDKEFSGYLKASVQTKDGKSQTKYGSDLTQKIVKYAVDQVVILFLDEVNVPHREELQSIEEQLLRNLVHESKCLVLITAGRSHPMLNDFALRPSATNTFLLSAFDEKTTGEQLEKLRPGSASVASQVLELGAGVPGNNTKLAAYVVGEPPNIPNELEAVQSLLTDLKYKIEERFHLVIEAICILPGFMPDDVAPLLETHPALVKKWDDNLFRESFPELRQVQIGSGSLINWDKQKKYWVMDEPTRLLFERELRLRDGDLWRKLQNSAYRMYYEWGERYQSQLYKAKAAYHQQCLQAAGYDVENGG